MRRILLALTIALIGGLAVGAVGSPVHAQVNNPSIAVSPTTVAPGNTATVTGTGFSPSNWVWIAWQRPDGTTGGTWVFTDATGAFAQQVGFLASHGSGTEWVTAYDWATGLWTPWTPVTVTSSTVGSPQISANPSSVTLPSPTESFTPQTTISGQHFTPSNWVYLYWQRPDGSTNAAWTQSDANGAFSFTLQFAPQHQCGTETVWAYDYATGVWTPPIQIAVHCGA